MADQKAIVTDALLRLRGLTADNQRAGEWLHKFSHELKVGVLNLDKLRGFALGLFCSFAISLEEWEKLDEMLCEAKRLVEHQA